MPERRRLGRELNLLAEHQLLVSNGEISQKDPPGNCIDDQMVRDDKEPLLSLRQLHQNDLEQRCRVERETGLDSGQLLRDSRRFLARFDLREIASLIWMIQVMMKVPPGLNFARRIGPGSSTGIPEPSRSNTRIASSREIVTTVSS